MAIAMVIIVALTGKVHATSSAPAITICHHTPANAVTLTFQNVQSYAGHLGTPHNNQTFDTAGACTSPTVTPSINPSPSSEPTVTVMPTAELTATPEATLTPSVEPTAGTTNGGDGKSDGLSSCPDCTKAHVMPAAPPATGKGE